MPIVSTEQPIDSSSAMLRFRWAPADGWIEAGQVHVLSEWGIVEHDDPVDVTVGLAPHDGGASYERGLRAIHAVIAFACAWKYPLTAAVAWPPPDLIADDGGIARFLDDEFNSLPEGVTLTVHL